MAMSANSRSASGSSFELVEFLRDELAPYPGRTATVGRTVTACILTMLAVMMFKLPNGFLAVFYALAISRHDARHAIRNGMLTLAANIASLLVALIGIVLFLDFPLPHFLFTISVFFLTFYLLRALANPFAAFGFSVIAVAATSVQIIWARPNPLRPDLTTVLGTAFGIMLGTLATTLTEWLFAWGAVVAPPDAVTPEAGAIFTPDAFTNPNHITFALKGCLATSLCYVFWSAIGWPGLGVCTVTCVLAAPTANQGSSRHRLITRLAAWLLGGVICGIGSQVWLLPSADSIVGFTLPFVAISAVTAWFMTAGPRLNYFGRQMALAYYLTIFQGFGPSASLIASRDRLMGILLGLLLMWLVFDVRWSAEKSGVSAPLTSCVS